MSRSGYSDDLDEPTLNLWRGAVASAIRGKRGQALLREMAAALDAMLVKELIASELENEGEYCALGVVGKARGIDMADIDPEDYEAVAETFGVATALTQEIMWQNDEAWSHREAPEHRWSRMRQWVLENIKEGK